MAHDIRTATKDDLEQILVVDARNFAYELESSDVELTNEMLDLDRFLVAVDDDSIVGIAGTFAKTLTMPGPAFVPMAGVTWVSVLATHRRQGVLTDLMAGLDAQATKRGEPMMGLLASEAPIYERFGYGVATRARSIELDRRRAAIKDRFRPESGSIRLIEPKDHLDEMVAIFERYTRRIPGAISRDAMAFRDQHFRSKKVLYGALHTDGFALWTIEPDWTHGQPNHRLVIQDLIAATAEAHLALWHTLLSVDLVGPISGWNAAAVDDPLPYLLDDPRALRTTDLNDYLWLKAIDPEACFRARPFPNDDEFVIAIGETPDGPTTTLRVGSSRAEQTDDRPDVTMTTSAVGPLLLGGVSASDLAAGRRLSADADVIDRLDRALTIRPLPDCRTPF